MSRQTPVRHARPANARRRVPIIALLVALAAVPMVVAVLAGSASLDGSSQRRRPFVAAPPDGSVTIGPSPDEGTAPAPGAAPAVGGDLSQRSRSFGTTNPDRWSPAETTVVPHPSATGDPGGGQPEKTCSDPPPGTHSPSPGAATATGGPGAATASGGPGEGGDDGDPPDVGGTPTEEPSTGTRESSDGGLLGGLLGTVGGLVG